jgi:hypothetical protein
LAGYKYNGAEDLRNTLYRPLYTELSQIESSLQQDVMLAQFTTNTKNTLEQSGEWNRLPRELRDSLSSVYAKASAAQGDLTFLETLQRSTSDRVRYIRTQEQDAAWTQHMLAALNAELRAKPGISGIRSFTMKHVGRSPALDMRSPTDPRCAQPGDIRWELQDWLTYPESAKHVEDIWDETQFLVLDDKREDWYFRITREDLRRNNIDLKTFLAPIFDTVKAGKIEELDRHRKEAISGIEALRTKIEGRITDPKRVSDLLEW